MLRRVTADQEARDAVDVKAMAAADGENLPWLRQVISGVGWPGKSLVGEDGAHAAWLLAQHAESVAAQPSSEGKPRAKAGRKRDDDRDGVILDAALAVLAEQGYEGMTIDMVAAHARH